VRQQLSFGHFPKQIVDACVLIQQDTEDTVSQPGNKTSTWCRWAATHAGWGEDDAHGQVRSDLVKVESGHVDCLLGWLLVTRTLWN
jgi:hypothetical protein